MRFSLRFLLIAMVVASLFAWVVAGVVRYQPRIDELLAFVGAVTLCLFVGGACTLIGWLAARSATNRDQSWWPLLMATAANWGGYSLLSANLTLTTRWDAWDKAELLKAVEVAYQSRALIGLAILIQLVLLGSGYWCDSRLVNLIGAVTLVVWLSLCVLLSIICAMAGIHFGGLA